MFFYFVVSIDDSYDLTSGIYFFNDLSDFYWFAVKICVRDVIFAFRSIAWLTSPKNDFWTPYGTSKFVNIS